MRGAATGGRAAAGAALAVLALTGCGDQAAGGEEAGRDLTVFAAASLADAFSEIGAAFSQANPDVRVAFNLAGSQQLAAQITEGAPADVFASANQPQMDVVAQAGLIDGQAEVFTANVLQIAVEPGNPRGITALEDLAAPGLTLLLAAPEVPAGRYARQALAAAGVQVRPASEEADVRAVLGKVALGEADAGIVYASDVAAAGEDVEGVEIPERANVAAAYPVAALTTAPSPDLARAFVTFLLSGQGQAILADHGFRPPP